MGVVLQMVQQNHDQAEQGHARLRGEWREHEERLAKMEAVHNALALRVEMMDKPSDLSAGMLPLRFVAPIVITGLIAAGAMWRLGSGIDELRGQMVSRAKLEDERHETEKAAIDELKKEMKLYEIKTDGLKDALMTKGVLH